jgi:hypothetical protein
LVPQAQALVGPQPGRPYVNSALSGYPAKVITAADVDGDGYDELVVVPDVAGSAGNDLWIRRATIFG